MDNWDEIRTAFQVARNGTVSGAAEVLGVHHATVIRHIDALEAQLGTKLFQRHARGYTPTEAGTDLLQVAQATDDQFSQLAGRIKGQGQGVAGDLVITSIAVFAGTVSPILAQIQADHPALKIRYLTGERLFRLEYGEAHVAIRSGRAPDQPDNVVQHLVDMPVHLCAAPSYIARHGLPSAENMADHHIFVGTDESMSRAPFNSWISDLGWEKQVRFQSDSTMTMAEAVYSGAGIGFVSPWKMREFDLTEIVPPQPDWVTPTWLVTHVDLHRTSKVQTVVKALKAAVANGHMFR
ncbi:MAG: LysR family transcriptional regulator [Pseudomonadota bacterium]